MLCFYPGAYGDCSSHARLDRRRERVALSAVISRLPGEPECKQASVADYTWQVSTT